MTPKQYRELLKRLGISQYKVADVLGIDRRTARRYALDESTIPAPTAKLLRLMAAGKVSAEDVEQA